MEQLRSIWDTMKYLIDEETGEIDDTVREIYEETMGLLHTDDEEPPEILTALRVSEYIFLNAKKMTQMELEEWVTRLQDLLREESNHEAHGHLTEGMLNVAYYLDNYSSNNPVAEDGEEEERCEHGKEFHEECYNCREEAEEAEEDSREKEERIERAVEYNLWFRDCGHKEVARMGCMS